MTNYHTKQLSLKLAEVSIHKFNETGVPHHLALLRNHRSNIEKCLALGDWDKIKREQINATRVIKQLKNLLIEMDDLRSRIVEQDVLRFDSLIRANKEKALAEINAYLQIDLRNVSKRELEYNESNQSRTNNAGGYQQQTHIPAIETEFDLSEHQLKSRETCLRQLDSLHSDLQDLHGIFHELHQTVEVQGETVTQVAHHVENTQIAVEQGESSLRQALKYKKAMYPMCGAIIGTCLGGPIGMLAGLKAGGIAAIGCGILGFTGGSAIKNNEQGVSEVDAAEETGITAEERKNE